MLGLLNARLVKRFPVRRILVVGLVGSTVAAALLLAAVVAGAGLVAVLAPLFVVVASRGLVSANATVLGIERSSAAGSASAVLGALMFAGGVLVTPLLAAGGRGNRAADGRGRRGWRGGCAAGDRAHDPAERPGVVTRSGGTSPA